MGGAKPTCVRRFVDVSESPRGKNGRESTLHATSAARKQKKTTKISTNHETARKGDVEADKN